LEKRGKQWAEARKTQDPESPKGFPGGADAAPLGAGGRKKGVPHGTDSGFLEFTKNKETGGPMGQENDVKKRGGGKHFTWEDRVRLETLVRTLYPGGRKPNFADFAGRLGWHQ